MREATVFLRGDKQRFWAVLTLLAVGAIGILPSLPVGAAITAGQSVSGTVWRPRVEARPGEGGSGELYVNDQLILRLRTSQGGLSPLNRATIAAQRLETAIAAGLRASDILADTQTDRTTPRLKGAGLVFASADKAEAKASSASGVTLVRGWASALRGALSVPGLAASDTDLLVPLGESRTLRLSGAARGSLAISAASGAPLVPAAPEENYPPTSGPAPSPGDTPAPKTVLSVTSSPSNENLLTVRGLVPGRETLLFERDGATVSVNVRVQPYAGRFDAPQTVTVTGRGVEVTRVARYAAATAVASAVPITGAIARVDADSVSVAMPVVAGASSTVTVPVTLTGPEMISVSRTVSVPLQNATLPPAPTGTLLYSNNPERVLSLGTLFAARLPESKTDSATRLLFHHQSALPDTAWFAVELLNDTDQVSRVQVIGGAAGPVRDTVWVGFRAASDFMRDYLADAGMIVDIPPHSRLALLSTRLPPAQTVSGLMQLRRISGPSPLVRVAAQPSTDARAQAETWQPAAILPGELNPTGNSLAYNISEHVYPEPVKQITAQYAVGGNWAFIGLGKDPLAANAGQKLYGNYGVWYDITATITNPTDKESKVRVVFVPSAGLAGGVFLVDGRPVEIPQTNVPQEPTLASYRLAPGETRTVKIATLPLSGSNYPARIVIRP